MTKQTDSRRLQFMKVIHRCGCRLDEAASAADGMIALLRDERNEVFRRLKKQGLSYRQIADVFDVDRSTVVKVVVKTATSLPPPPGSTLNDAG